MKKTHAYPLFLLLLSLLTCQKETISLSGSGQPGPVETDETHTYSRVAGYVQKGPFLNGTSIQLAELTKALVPTGNSFTTQIVDNRGSFGFRDVALRSHYVQLRADGFYYNEVTDLNSAAQLTLYTHSDISQREGLNVNLLSHLERSRVEYLLGTGLSFTEAKQRAQDDIFGIFGLEQEGARESELLDISEPGEDNAKLLAISVMLQGYLTTSDFSELLANISTDIREDGILNSRGLGTQLVNSANLLRTTEIRQHLEQRYELLGQTVTIPRFEQYVRQFVETTTFEYTGAIRYPERGAGGVNILDTNQVYNTEGHYAMTAELPAFTTLKVKISGTNWGFRGSPPTASGWDYTDREPSDSSRVFTTNRTGTVDLGMVWHIPPHTRRPSMEDRFPGIDPADYPQDTVIETPPPIPVYTRIELYENGAEEPNWTKTFVIE